MLNSFSIYTFQVDRFGQCDLCAPGMVLSRGSCIIRADFVHIDMDGESDDVAVCCSSCSSRNVLKSCMARHI